VKHTIEVEQYPGNRFFMVNMTDDSTAFGVALPDHKKIDRVIFNECEPESLGDGMLRKTVTVYYRDDPPWQYPEWLGGAGVAMDKEGRWLVMQEKPLWFCSQRDESSSKLLVTSNFMAIDNTLHPLWSPPPCDDWRKSWHPNPKWQG